MNDQEKRQSQHKQFAIICFLAYILLAYYTLHFHHVITSTEVPFNFLNIESYNTAAITSIQENIIVQPSKKTLQIMFFELFVISFYAIYKITTQKNFMPNKEYGTARWANNSERNRLKLKGSENNIILTKTERLGLDTRKTKKNLNFLVIGGAGTGKSRAVVKPNLLQCNTSFVVTDPKGELLRDTGYSLQTRGYKVKVLNLINMSQSCKYNPFAYIRKESDVLKLINNLIKNTTPIKGGGGDPFWEKAETALLQAILLYIFYELNVIEHNFKTVFAMLRLAEVKEDNEDFKSQFDFLFEKMREEKPNHIAVKQYDIYKMASGKTAKSILISAGVRLSPFSIEEVENLLSKDELELQTLGNEKTALFVLIPDSDTTFNFIVSMMYSQLFDSLYYQADFVHNGRLKHHVKFWLDEFANIGQIPDFDKLIATMRSREISVTPILQNLTQLKTLYKDSWETIVGNCDSILFLGGQERSTLEWVNKGLGKQTIDTKTSSQSKNTSVNFGQTGRDLMTIDEIAQMPDNKCILFVRGVRPFYSDKYKLEQHPHYKTLYEANEENHFDPIWGVKKQHEVDGVLKSFNARHPDQGLEERKESIKLVDVEALDDIESRMDALI